MADSITTLRTRVRNAIGDVQSLVTDPVIDPWLNEGQARLKLYLPKSQTVSWAAAAASIALNADVARAEEILLDENVDPLPSYRIWGAATYGGVPTIYFVTPSLVTAGSGRLFYWSLYPAIAGGADSQLPPLGDSAIVSFAEYRFYKMLAGSRSDYRRYSTITQANGVGVSDLDTLSERALVDFESIRDALQDNGEDLDSASTFF